MVRKARYQKIPDAIYLKVDDSRPVMERVVSFKMPKPLKNRVYPDTPIVEAIKRLRPKYVSVVRFEAERAARFIRENEEYYRRKETMEDYVRWARIAKDMAEGRVKVTKRLINDMAAYLKKKKMVDPKGNKMLLAHDNRVSLWMKQYAKNRGIVIVNMPKGYFQTLESVDKNYTLNPGYMGKKK